MNVSIHNGLAVGKTGSSATIEANGDECSVPVMGEPASTPQWQDVSETAPCPICGKADWCSRSSDGSVIHCRREGKSSARQGWELEKRLTDSNGQVYSRWRSLDVSPTTPTPAVPNHPRAEPDLLNTVYSAFLKHLPLPRKPWEQLQRRGLSRSDLRNRKYHYLDERRQEAVAGVIDAGLEEHLPLVPGFYRDAQGKWQFAGPQGIAISVRDREGRIVAIKIRADDQGGKKLKSKYVYASSKKQDGPGPGSPVHVPLHGDNWDLSEIRITEGELKADVATAKTGILTLGLPGVTTFRKAKTILEKFGAKAVIIAFDADYRSNQTVATAREDAIEYFSTLFDTVVEDWPEEWGKGIDDVLTAGLKPKRLEDNQAKASRRGAATTGANGKRKHRKLPEIIVSTMEKEVNDQAVAALAEDPSVYKRAGVLVHVIPEDSKPKKIYRPEGTPSITELPRPILRERLADAALWQKESGEKLIPTHPPDWSVNAVHARGSWLGVRSLEGIAPGPVLRADGTILAKPGYDPDTGLICECPIAMPEIPTNPSRGAIHDAVTRLREVVVDFPFQYDYHEATWMAFLLTLLAKPAFPGPSPLYLIDSNVRGSGKGLLSDATAIIATGRGIPRMPNPTNDEEARKLITSLAIAGDLVILIDNVEGTLGTPSLDAALTSTSWRDRILGRSQIVELPLLATWCATGNNIVLAGDMTRRVAHIRLEAMVEKPEERADFEHPKLPDWVQKNRPQLLAAGLTLLRGFWAAGRPSQGLAPWGSFDGWSDLVRSTVVWAGLPDPGDARQEIAKHDTDAQALTAVLAGLQAFDPESAGLTSSDILRRIFEPDTCNKEAAEMLREGMLQLTKTSGGAHPGPRTIGMTLHHQCHRVVGGRYLDKRMRNHTAAWFVRDAAPGTKGTTGTSPTLRAEIGVSDACAEPGNSGDECSTAPDGAEISPLSPPSPRPDKDHLVEDVEVF